MEVDVVSILEARDLEAVEEAKGRGSGPPIRETLRRRRKIRDSGRITVVLHRLTLVALSVAPKITVSQSALISTSSVPPRSPSGPT